MDELEELKRQRIDELQNQQNLESQITQLESIVRTVLTKEALQRYGNLKAAHPEKAVQLLVIIGQLMQSGKARIISDDELKKLLIMMQPKKMQFKITRK